MKRLKTILLAVLCTSLLLSCGKHQTQPAEEINWVHSRQVTISWDPSSISNQSSDEKNLTLRYHVYIDADADDTHDDKILKTPCGCPTEKTQYTIAGLNHRGRFYVGIQAFAYEEKEGKPWGCPIYRSEISWSSNEAITKEGPFGIVID